MKSNFGKYEEVERLPGKAMTIREYAESNRITPSYVYKMFKEGKADFRIVIFKTHNYVVPK